MPGRLSRRSGVPALLNAMGIHVNSSSAEMDGSALEAAARATRRLGFFDLFTLWFSLGVGLLVLQAGTFLVPALGLAEASLAVVLGTLLGTLPLAAVGWLGSVRGLPTMMLTGSVLGRRGSYVPSVLNVIQLVGWTAFELWVMAVAASRVSAALFGYPGYPLWLVGVAAFCVLLALGGPLIVVRQYLKRIGLWLMLIASLWLTAVVLTQHDLGDLWSRPGQGGMPFGLAMDLVVAMPVSWLPLIADYTRYARGPRGAFWGSYLGYVIANIWFYLLGALLSLVWPLHSASPAMLASAILSLGGGLVAMVAILVDETDNAFADLYSAAVSVQNVVPSVPRRWLVLVLGLVSLLLAAFSRASSYVDFLLVFGGLFVPLFGVLIAGVVVRRRSAESERFPAWPGFAAWACGIALYQVISHWAPQVGASLPSFALSFLAYWILAPRVLARRAPG